MRGWSSPVAAPSAAAASATITATIATTTTLVATAPDGAALFAINCAGCHGDKGRGGAVVREGIELEERTDVQLRPFIQQGRGSMPGFGQLSATELDALIAAMRSWNK
jgi:mono/diheme cytochrome c family protein